MPSGMVTPENFKLEKDDSLKINILYELVYELYRKKRCDGLKVIFGGFLGGFAAIAAKFAIWR